MERAKGTELDETWQVCRLVKVINFISFANSDFHQMKG